MDRGAGWATVHSVAELDTTEATEHAHTQEEVNFVRMGSFRIHGNQRER